MKNRKTTCKIIVLSLLITLLLSIPTYADEVSPEKYTLTYSKQLGTVKEKVTLVDYDIKDQEFEMILLPKGSTVTFTPSITMYATITGLTKENGVFEDTYDGVMWIVDGEGLLVTGVEGGKTAVGNLGYYPYYMFDISDDENMTRIIFKMVDEKDAVSISDKISSDLEDIPDTWAKQEVENAISLGLVPSHMQSLYKENITRDDFCNLVVNMIEIKTGKDIDNIISEKGLSTAENPFTDTDEKWIIYANQLGIVNGKGNGIFDPNGSITRQEAAVMLTNAAKVLEAEIIVENTNFADNKEIANWAKGSVDYVFSKEIMNGVGDNKFSPKSTYTRQQAFMTIVRLYNILK